MRLSIEKRTTAFIVTLALFSLTVGIFVIWPTITRIKELHKQTQDLRQFLERKYERSFRLHNSLASIQTLSTETKAYESYVLHREDELQLVTFLENMASKERVTQTIQSSNLDNDSTHYIKLSLLVKGSYSNILRYLTALERSFPYFAVVENIKLAPEVNRQNQNVLGDQTTLSLNLRFYVE